MACGRRKSEGHSQYPKVAPPLRHKAEEPTLRFAFLKNRLFSSTEMSCDVRTKSMADSTSDM